MMPPPPQFTLEELERRFGLTVAAEAEITVDGDLWAIRVDLRGLSVPLVVTAAASKTLHDLSIAPEAQ